MRFLQWGYILKCQEYSAFMVGAHIAPEVDLFDGRNSGDQFQWGMQMTSWLGYRFFLQDIGPQRGGKKQYSSSDVRIR